MIIALVLGLVFNLAMYWWSGSIAVAIDPLASRSPRRSTRSCIAIVRELTQAQGMPMPGIYVSEMAAAQRVRDGTQPRATPRSR